jgi:hypothetical protein
MYGVSVLIKEGVVLTEINPRNIVFKNGSFKIKNYESYRKVG